MIPEERQPALRGIRVSRGSPNPSRDTPLREIEAQLEKFAVNARRSPSRILDNHAKHQSTNFLAHASARSYSPGSGNPCPIQPEASPMPAHDGSGSDQDERLCPPGPEPFQRDPEQLVQRGESTARSGGEQS